MPSLETYIVISLDHPLPGKCFCPLMDYAYFHEIKLHVLLFAEVCLLLICLIAVRLRAEHDSKWQFRGIYLNYS